MRAVSPAITAGILGLLLAAACGMASDAKSGVTTRDTTLTDSAKALAMPAPATPIPARPAPPQTAAAATATIPDTARPILIAGRKKHDSVAFASTVAFGRRMAAKWPAPPEPLP